MQEMDICRRGVSAVETMVVLAIVALLLSIVLPLLQAARSTAHDAGSLANLRTHGMAFSQYASSYRENFPYFTSPAGPVEIPYGGRTYKSMYFEAHYRWPLVLASEYYGGIAPHPTQNRPGSNSRAGYSYYYSATMLADPAFWNESTRTDADQWRGTRRDEVLYPSRKALLVESGPLAPPYWNIQPSVRVLIGSVDGAAQARRAAEFIPPIRSGEGDYEGAIHRFGIFGMHTRNGIRGMDTR